MYCRDFQQIWPKVTLLPISQLLADLKEQPSVFDVGLGPDFNGSLLDAFNASSEEDICLAEVGGNAICVFFAKEGIWRFGRR